MANELCANDYTDNLNEDVTAMNAHIPQKTIINVAVMDTTIPQDIIINATAMNAVPKEIVITSSSTPILQANNCPKCLERVFLRAT